MCWRWFVPFYKLKVLPKLMLTIGPIMEWDVDLLTSSVSRVSNNSSIGNLNVVKSWYICGFHSNFIYYSSNVAM